jgi:deoxyadenosine/deoxycytidine kinase
MPAVAPDAAPAVALAATVPMAAALAPAAPPMAVAPVAVAAAAAPVAVAAAAAPVLIVEGEIGAGKSELTKALAAELAARGKRVCLILEPVEQWNATGALQMFYENPARHAYGFQSYVFATRILAIRAAIEASPDVDAYILERSPATDLIFMYAQRDLVSPTELRMYETWCGAWRLMLPIDLSSARVLYLKPSLSTCMTRVAQRHRDGEIRDEKAAGAEAPAEGGVSVEYQQQLRRLHEAYLLGVGADKYPGLPASPFARDAVTVVGPDTADLDWRLGSAESSNVAARILRMVGL